MKFIVKKNNLMSILNASKNISELKTNYSILANILIETKSGGKLAVSASNMDMSMYSEIDANIEIEGSITINEKMLSNIMKEMPNDDILFELKENSIIKIKSLAPKIKCAYDIISMPKDEFPVIETFPVDVPFLTFDKLLFKKMFKKTIFAISPDITKYSLNGVFFEKTSSDVKMISIDGRRMAYIQSDNKNTDDVQDFNVIIPPYIIDELLKIMDGEGILKFSFYNNKLFFQFDNFTFISNVISGKFPNYSLFMPKDEKYFFIAKNDELMNALKRVSILMDVETNKINFTIDKNLLNISAKNFEYGNAEEEIFIEYSGDKIQLAFSNKYLYEILKEIETEDITFSFKDEISPVLIKEKNRDEYFFIIMPMKLN